jgi:hypothetical protein
MSTSVASGLKTAILIKVASCNVNLHGIICKYSMIYGALTGHGETKSKSWMVTEYKVDDVCKYVYKDRWWPFSWKSLRTISTGTWNSNSMFQAKSLTYFEKITVMCECEFLRSFYENACHFLCQLCFGWVLFVILRWRFNQAEEVTDFSLRWLTICGKFGEHNKLTELLYVSCKEKIGL